MRNLQNILLIFLLSTICSFAAPSNDIWIFGKGASLKFESKITDPIPLTDTLKINSLEASATGFDQNGNLLFYTDGEKVWNYKNDVIYSELKGSKNATQGVTVFRSDKNDKEFYLITNNTDTVDVGAYIYNISFSANPNGEVNNKPQYLDSSYNAFERVVVIPSKTEGESWIVINPRYKDRTSYIIYSFKNGIAKFKERYISPMHRNYNTGYLRASPNGRFLASADYDGNEIEVAEFDVVNGKVLTTKSFNDNELEHGVYGLDFSPNSGILYISTWFYLGGDNFNTACLQFDVNSYLFNGVAKTYRVEQFQHKRDIGGMWALKLGINDKIYIARENKKYLSVINKPNIWGPGCDFVESGPAVTTKNDVSLIGLPSTASNNFVYEYEVIDLAVCEKSPIYYDPEFNVDYNDYAWYGNLKEITTKALLIGTSKLEDSGIYYLTNKRTNQILVAVNVSVGSPVDIRFRLRPSVITCDTDSATISVRDKYKEYLWSDGSTGSSLGIKKTGKYFLNAVDSSGCKLLDSIEVFFSPPPQFEIIVERIGCNDEFRLTSSKDFNNYEWSTGEKTKSIVVNRAGKFHLKIINTEDCFTTKEIDVKSVKVDIKLNFPDGSFICTNEIIRVQIANPDTNVTYKWSNGYKTLETAFQNPGKYYVEATDKKSGCVYRKEFTISSADEFELKIISSYDCITGAVTLTSNAANSSFNFNWSNGSKSNTTTVEPGNVYTLLIESKEQKCEFYDTLFVEKIIAYTPKLEFPKGRLFCSNDILPILVSNPNERYEYSWSNGEEGVSTNVASAGDYKLIARDKVTSCEKVIDFKIEDFSDFELKISQEFDCNTSTVLLTANVEDYNFRYNWSTGGEYEFLKVSKLGIYTLEVTTPAGCKLYDTISVSKIKSFELTVIPFPNDTLCTAGQVQLRLVNKSPLMKSQKWSNGSKADSIIVSKSGTYILEGVDAEGCVVRDTTFVLITDTPVINIKSSKGKEICEGESTILSIEGIDDVSNYTYLWSNGKKNPSISVTESGDYVVTVAIKGTQCISLASFRVDTKPTPSVTIHGKASICKGGATKLYATYNEGRLKWSNGETTDTINVSIPGDYIATVENGLSCSASDTIIVGQTEPPDVSIIGKDRLCDGDTITLSADKQYVSYKWSTGDFTESIKIAKPGTYKLIVLDSNGCENSTSFQVNGYGKPFYVTDILISKDSLLMNENLDYQFTLHNESNEDMNFDINIGNESKSLIVSKNTNRTYKVNKIAEKLGVNSIEVIISSTNNCQKDTVINFEYEVYTVLKAVLPNEFYQYLNINYDYEVKFISTIPLDLKLAYDLELPKSIFYTEGTNTFDEQVLISNEYSVAYSGLTLLGAPLKQDVYFNSIETDNPYVIIDTSVGSIEVGRVCLGDKALVTYDYMPELQVYPNPTTSFLYVDIISPDDKSVELVIISQTGKVVLEKVMLNTGSNKVSLSQIANGSYTLFLKSALWERQYRFNKVD